MQNDHKETQKRRNIKRPPGDTKPLERDEKQPQRNAKIQKNDTKQP